MTQHVWAYVYGPTTEQSASIFCFGPAYANVVSLNATNGNATISITLDPSSAGCSGENISSPVVLNISGQANGLSTSSRKGSGEERFGGMTFTYHFRESTFSETFNGTAGFFLLPLDGSAVASRQDARTRVK